MRLIFQEIVTKNLKLMSYDRYFCILLTKIKLVTIFSRLYLEEKFWRKEKKEACFYFTKKIKRDMKILKLNEIYMSTYIIIFSFFFKS